MILEQFDWIQKILEPVAWFCCFRHIYSKMQLIVTSVFSMFIYVSPFYPETLVQMIRCPFCLSHNQLVGVLKCLQNHPPNPPSIAQHLTKTPRSCVVFQVLCKVSRQGSKRRGLGLKSVDIKANRRHRIQLSSRVITPLK